VTDWREAQHEKDQKVKHRLARERSVLIKDGKPTPKLQLVLREIFGWYSDDCGTGIASSNDEENVYLSQTMASQLWYRCGMKLSSLDSMLATKEVPTLCFRDFLSLIEQVIEEDTDSRSIPVPEYRASSASNFEVRLFRLFVMVENGVTSYRS
jgi:hypothetical protein